MLIMSGIWQIFLGIAAIVGSELFVVVEGYIYSFDTTVWGWIHILIGAVFVVVGFFLFRGSTWAVWAAIGVAIVNGLLNFLWLPIYPIWALVLIAIDVAVVRDLATWRDPGNGSGLCESRLLVRRGLSGAGRWVVAEGFIPAVAVVFGRHQADDHPGVGEGP